MTEISNTKVTKKPRALYIGGIVFVLASIALVLFLSTSKNSAVERDTKARDSSMVAGPRVRIAAVVTSAASEHLVLQGEARPYASVTLYAKVSGYLKDIKVDKGDKVSEGETLATIESPETDRAYLGALADAKNKRAIAARNVALLAKKLIAPQDAEQSEANAQISEQQLESLKVQKGYELLLAPFSGTVTARYADRGALVQNAMNSQTSALPVLTIAQVDHLRIEVYLDQRYATYVHQGDSVTITLLEKPGYTLHAAVTRFTGQLDDKTRTLLVEIEVPNKDRAIVAGSFVNVGIKIGRTAMMQIPSNALVVRKDKFFVPVVTANNTVHYREVHIGSNDGQTVQVVDGLNGDEKLAINLGEAVADGSRVQPVEETAGH